MVYKPFYRPTKAREALGIGNTKIWELIKEGKLTVAKIGRATVITNLPEFVDELKKAAA